jgi:nucleoside-diphosphate-sugar epimerase
MFLVTGANGFIGSQVVQQLVAKGSDILVYHSSSLSSRLASVRDKIKSVSGDLMEWETLFEAVKEYQVDTIVHLAYYRDIVEQERRSLKATRINCLGFNNILEVARLSGVKRVVWCSSIAVYGPPEQYTGSVNEDSPTHPTTVYGACKVFNEFMADHYQRQYGLEVIGLRPAIVYGQGRWYSGQASFARDLFVNALMGQPTLVEGADRRIDWIHVCDVAQAFVKACFVKSVKHNVFNLFGEAATIRQGAEILRELIPSANIELRPGGKEPWPVERDWSRAREELGYQPAFGLKRGISEYLEFLRGELGSSGRIPTEPEG